MSINSTQSPDIPVAKPQLPTADDLFPYLQRIDQNRWYSNHGPLLLELEQRFAEHFNVATSQLCVVANGTVALSAALVASGARPGTRCLLPSWTFVGSASAVWAANLRPHFVDVDAGSWQLDPAAIAARPDLDDVGAVMVVSPFGSPVNSQAWDDFTAKTGIPVIIDCAASFDTVARIKKAAPGSSLTMVSLHATKVLGTAEGGLILSRDEEAVNRVRRVCNFGVLSSPEGQILGYNGKLNEYSAAIGLAALENWDERRTQLEHLTSRYHAALSSIPGIELLPDYGNGWVSVYCNINLGIDSARAIKHLDELGIKTRRWWQSGVHQQPAYAQFTRDDLPVTTHLGKHVFGLPFFHDMTDDDLNRVIDAVAKVLKLQTKAS